MAETTNGIGLNGIGLNGVPLNAAIHISIDTTERVGPELHETSVDQLDIKNAEVPTAIQTISQSSLVSLNAEVKHHTVLD
ncbi:hypothetical protein RA28_21785 [Ruegeria sp. ANG-S4]|uniref:hypothetical protein n=1 Tax=Ruegeria sp. ANG-S4 TaxID=1577904 RepID=UPI00057D87F4|nr:hypothetical protein [Ruegeria sp. ANG-S4]KIC41004.1 hypothetical protein RA28_21785 [Ruegeria sp. ANG-S4]